MSFMSTAPRPQIMPSLTSAANGSTDQSSFSAGTTSKCPWTISAGSELSVPFMRVTTLVRPGEDSKSCGSRPASVISPAVYSAASRSPGPWLSPKFEVSKRINVRQISSTSSTAFTGLTWAFSCCDIVFTFRGRVLPPA